MSYLSQLRQLFSVYFSESELKTICFDLGLDYEMLPGSGKGDRARELISHMWRNGRLPELVELGRELRPNLAWPAPDRSPDTELSTPASPGVRMEQPAGLASTNPFTYGNPISDPSRFFGRSRAIEQVFNRLRNAEAESSSIVGGRRIGKSSLLNYLAHPDVRRRYGMDPERSFFVYVDLQMVDHQTTPARLWHRLLTQAEHQAQQGELAEKLREVLAGNSFDNFTLADLFDVVDRQARHIVFLLDEFENVTGNPNFDPGFFYGLRSLAIQHSLSLVTSSQHELIELTHSQAVRSSPFFNIFANINVRLLTAAEAAQLLTALPAGTGIAFTEEETLTIGELTGGHPFFMQIAGHFLFEAYSEYSDASRRRASWLDAFRREAGPHLAHFWHTAREHQRVTLLLLALLTRQATGRPYFEPGDLENLYSRAGQDLTSLSRLGYVAEEAGQFALFSRVFADWIADEVRTTSREQPAARNDEALASLSELPASIRRAIAPALAKTGKQYQNLVAAWLANTHKPEQAVSLLQQSFT